jgi:hypothetical protein
MVVGGESGTRTCIARLLARDPYVVSATGDAEVALTWLRACTEPMSVIVNTTATLQYLDFLHAVAEEAQLIRHTYLLMVPTGHWLSADQRELLGMLNAPVVKKPFAPSTLRASFQTFVGSAPDARMSR